MLLALSTDVYVSGEGGYHTFRIPAIIATKKSTLLAFAEGRRGGQGDAGDIDLLLRRSLDNGKTWQPIQTVADLGDDTIGNPAPVVDQSTGDIILLMTRNGGKITERMIEDGQGIRTVWITRSKDDGVTWSTPVEISSQVRKPDWTWYATGPGNGIQLRKTGRLVIPCDHTRAGTKARHSHLIYSDDHGATWKIGAIAEEKTNESAVAELPSGELMFNMRSYHGKNRRAVQRSNDAGLTLTPLTLDEALIEPVCQASLIAYRKKWLVFSNPASTKRERLTVRRSDDGGKTWGWSRVLHEGPAAYSSLVELRKGEVGVLYERGDRSAYEKIVFETLRPN
ncbi:sialidase [Bryobacterales bacterium F-183]|nr:sialidase [Bryobacterales bacterium F-183]